MYVKERSPVAVILFSILTCGIYGLYWIYATSQDLQSLDSNHDSTSPGLELVLCIITCGLYTFFWYYKYAKIIYGLQLQKNIQPADDNGILYIILAVFGLSIISVAIMQSSINKTILYHAETV